MQLIKTKQMKGLQLGGMSNAIVTFVVIAVVAAFGLIFLERFKLLNVTSASANTAIDQAATGISVFPEWLGLIALAIVFALILTIILSFVGGQGE